MKLVNALFKDDPLGKQLKKLGLLTDILTIQIVQKSILLFRQKTADNHEQGLLKYLIKQLEQKGTYARKMKIMFVLLQISKISKYDVCDIVLNKKIKIFIKPTKHKHNQIEPKGQKLQEYILQELLIPLYNYLMKLATNEELYNTCKQGEIPFDQIFRRGSKIRFIWIFKLYNLISIILPIIDSLLKAFKVNPSLIFFQQCTLYLFNDAVIINNFIIKALEEASTDNFMLMPYFDMLQFHQSLHQQLTVGKAIHKTYDTIVPLIKGLLEPQKLSLKPQQIEEIDIQALRVKLISNSLKNPKKDHKILETEYNQKIQHKQKRMRTQGNMHNIQLSEDFKQKYRHLD